MGGRTGPDDVGELRQSKTRVEESHLQLRIAHVMQHCQTPLDLPDPILQHLLTGVRWTDGATKETEALTGNRDIGWQGGEGGVTTAGDVEEGLASVEVEAHRGSLRLHNVECSREIPHQGAVVKVPGIQGKVRHLSLDTFDNGMEG